MHSSDRQFFPVPAVPAALQSLLEQSAEQVERVVRTNLLGSLLVTRAALRGMAEQPGGGHIFNLEGAGADGSATPKVGKARHCLNACPARLCCAGTQIDAYTAHIACLAHPPSALALQYAAYGATKIGIAQLQRTMKAEAAGLPNPVGVHNLSPGMVLTELLLEGATPANKQVGRAGEGGLGGVGRRRPAAARMACSRAGQPTRSICCRL